MNRSPSSFNIAWIALPASVLPYFCYYRLPKWSAVLWAFACCKRTVHKGRDRGTRRARVCLEQRCPCVVVLVGGCFFCSVSGAVDFLLSSSYFFWVVWNLVNQGQLLSWRASRPLFGPHGENFDFSTIVRDFVTVERYADAFASSCRVCWKFFRHLLERQLTWCLSLACIGVVALARMCRVTLPRYIMSDFLACGKFSPVRRKCGAVR